MRPYLNLDFEACYLGHATGLFLGDFCLFGLAHYLGRFGWRVGVILFNFSAGVFGD